jgi:hypothetical protein
MNYGRLVIAAVAGTVVDAAYGFLVYGMLLQSSFAQYPGVYRPAAMGMDFMPYLMGGIFLAMLAAAFIYAKGYEGGSGLVEGARFGAAIGLFAVGYSAIVNYATVNVGRRHTAMMGTAALCEWIIDGIVLGLVYKPATSAVKRARV